MKRDLQVVKDGLSNKPSLGKITIVRQRWCVDCAKADLVKVREVCVNRRYNKVCRVGTCSWEEAKGLGSHSQASFITEDRNEAAGYSI